MFKNPRGRGVHCTVGPCFLGSPFGCLRAQAVNPTSLVDDYKPLQSTNLPHFSVAAWWRCFFTTNHDGFRCRCRAQRDAVHLAGSARLHWTDPSDSAAGSVRKRCKPPHKGELPVAWTGQLLVMPCGGNAARNGFLQAEHASKSHLLCRDQRIAILNALWFVHICIMTIHP